MCLSANFFLINDSLNGINVIIGATFFEASLGSGSHLSNVCLLQMHMLLVLGHICHHFVDVFVPEMDVVSGLLARNTLLLLNHECYNLIVRLCLMIIVIFDSKYFPGIEVFNSF